MNSKKNIIRTIFTILIILAFEPSYAVQGDTQVGHYLTVSNTALASQTDPLQEIIQVRFPATVKTVGDAMHYLLRFSSYQLGSDSQLMPEVKVLLKLSLPQSNRNLGPVSLKEGLLTLAGQPYGLFIDPVHRLISFRLLAPYSSLYQK